MKPHALLRLLANSARAALVAVPMALSSLGTAQAELTLRADEYAVFHHHDALGSAVATSDALGNVLWHEHTEPYGRSFGRRSTNGGPLDSDPFAEVEEEGRSRVAYTGHVRDGASDLVYMQQRHYDPELGRFLSNDPVGFTATNPASFNRYAYANNNPYSYVDPDGRQAVENEGESDDTAADIVAEIQATRQVTTDALNTVSEGMSLAGDVSTLAIGGGVGAGAKAGGSLLSRLAGLFGRGGAKGAATRLGIDLDKVSVVDGVARATIGQVNSLDPKDVQKLKAALKARGASSAQIETGLLANPKLDSFMRARAADGRTFQGGIVQHSRSPDSDYTITFGLQ